jgi:MFS family permease
MLKRALGTWKRYPPQFWLIFFGRFIAMAGVSMIWPFLLLYVSKQLVLPLTQVASLMTVNGFFAIAASLVSGPLVDRFGRKWIMVVSLFAHATAYLVMTQAESFLAFAGLMAITGAVNPMYRVGAEAMLADLVDPEDRAEAFALVRWSNNLGVAMGPVLGGYLVVISYLLTFRYAASGLILYGVLLLVFARETLPETCRRRL